MIEDDRWPIRADGSEGTFSEGFSAELCEALVRADGQLSDVDSPRSGRGLHAALDWLLTSLRLLLRVDGGSIYLRHGDILRLTVVQNTTLERQWGLHTVRSWLQDLALPIAPGSVAGYVARTGNAVNISDVEHIPVGSPYEFNPALDDATYRYRSMVTAPIAQEPADVLGVLQLINALDETGRAVAFGPEAETIIRRCAALVAHVIVTRSDPRN